MKAIVVNEFGPPEVMQLEEIEQPSPAGTQVLIKVEAVGVNPIETYFRAGQYPVLPPLPYTPGKDAAGVVEAIGEKVTRWKKGDRVYTADSITGTYAEYTVCEEIDLGRLPDNVSYEEGAGIWTPCATAYRALFQKAHAKGGEIVLIHGASGAVGVAAIQWAKNAGLTVIGTASSEDGKDLVKKQGADHVLDHTDPAHFSATRELTGGTGVQVIIEMLANVNLQNDFDALAMFGRIVVVGNRGSLDFNPRVIMGKDAAIYGMALFNSSQTDRDEIHAAIHEALTNGFLAPTIRTTMPLADAVRAHHEVIENKGFGKIVLVP
jgi:NADPH2:quinone reductase